MNCQLRKYRTQIIGYEGAAGAPQAAHYHHVRGIGTDGDDSQHYHR
jgi:sirohydrochlorin cobaltochelatase